MRFTKMQGTGNDYVYVNGFEEEIADPPALARRVSDRHFGIGSDGLIIIRPPSAAGSTCRMEMYNADGSRGRMCGNGIRCVAKYVHDRGMARGTRILIDTDAGTKAVRVLPGPDGKAAEVEVDMGAPRLARSDIPFADGGDPRRPAIQVPLDVAGTRFRLTTVSMGNPHAVIRLPDPPDGPALGTFPVAEVGPPIETHPWFPERINVEFIVVRSRSEMDFRVWERGSGETMACGTGACAALVACVLNGWCEPDAVVHLRGGDLRIRWEGARPAAAGGHPEGGTVMMTGTAVEVFSGLWPGS